MGSSAVAAAVLGEVHSDDDVVLRLSVLGLGGEEGEQRRIRLIRGG